MSISSDASPFDSIALACSGGGYRAACFTLGTLSLFEHFGLRENIKAISTVSGGTITGVRYLQALIDGEAFSDFFHNFYGWLEKDELHSNAVKHLKNKNLWKKEYPYKFRNLINAFAIEYQSLAPGTIGDLDDLLKGENCHLERAIVNASDFNNGLQFRFQSNKEGRRIFGNKRVKGKVEKRKIRLADVIAASSCFPGGMEPIRYPNDFLPGEDWDEGGDKITLMDGGITDNQGISSFFTKKRGKEALFGIYFVVDVTSPYIAHPFQHFPREHFLNIFGYALHWLTILLFAGLAVVAYWANWSVVFTILVCVTTFLFLIRFLLGYLLSKAEKMVDLKGSLKLPSALIPIYLFDRIRSLVSMANDVFLKAGRRSSYDLLYEVYDKELEHRRTTATIYELRCHKGHPKKEKMNRPEGQMKSDWKIIKEKIGPIPENIKDIAKEASEYPTTLWFTSQEEDNKLLDKLIVCGQVTACYNWLSLMALGYADRIDLPGDPVAELWKKALWTWGQFVKDPYFLLKEMKAVR